MRQIIFLITTALLATACPDQEVAPDATPCPMDIEIGPKRVGDFHAFASGENAELTLGFQGFRYISSSVRIAGDEAQDEDQGVVLFQIAVDGQDEPYSFTHPFKLENEEADGWRYDDGLQVFFNDIPVAETVGKSAAITARGTLGNCVGVYTMNINIVDEEQCIEQPDGSLLCE